jgi:hypothetical protein
LIDASNVTFALATIDEAIRTALADYSVAYPLTLDSTITLGAAGREIDLSTLTGLINVLDVWWPYAASPEVWPPNQVPGFHLWWNNAVPKLLISSQSGSQPQSGDGVRVWYSKQHTISSLDGAAATSVLPLHETGIVIGAAAYAVTSEMRHQIGVIHVDPQQVASLNAYATERMAEFKAWLAEIHVFAATAGALKHTLAIRNAGAP